MACKGGYLMVDLKGRSLKTKTTTTVEGIYARIEGNYRKPILLTGIVIDSVPMPDSFIEVVANGNSYSFSAYGKNYTVSDSDVVSMA